MYTKEEIELIQKAWNGSKQEKLALCEKLGRSYTAIRSYTRRHGIQNLKQYWSKEENDFLRHSYGTITASEIGKILNRSKSSITAQARNLGLNGQGFNIDWSPEELVIIKNNLRKLTCKEIANLLPGRTESSVYSQIQKHGWSKIPHSHNECFFSVPGLGNSYWAGFIAADGTVYTDGAYTVAIALSSKDKEHLICFKNDCAYTGKIRDYSQKRQEKEKDIVFSYSKIAVCGAKTWTIDLNNNYNITSRKTFSLEPPKLEGVNAIAFVCGLIDGDGSIFGDRPNYLNLSIFGTKNVLEWVKDVLNPFHSHTTVPWVRPHRSIWQYRVNGCKDMLLRLKELNAPLPLMRRKWDKVT